MARFFIKSDVIMSNTTDYVLTTYLLHLKSLPCTYYIFCNFIKVEKFLIEINKFFMSHKREKRKGLKKWESPKGHLKKVSMYCSKQQGGNKFS